MAATNLIPDPLTVAGALIIAASLTTLVVTIADRLLGTPPPGHAPVGWLERAIAAGFVLFLSIGPAWLVFTLSGGTCT